MHYYNFALFSNIVEPKVCNQLLEVNGCVLVGPEPQDEVSPPNSLHSNLLDSGTAFLSSNASVEARTLMIPDSLW